MKLLSSLLLLATAAFAEPVYKSPVDLALDDGRLLVVCSGSDTLQIYNLADDELTAEVAVGHQPSGVAVGDGFAYVTNEDDDTVSVVDLESFEVIRTLPTGWAPQDAAVDPAGRRLYVANGLSKNVSVIDLESGTETKRLRAGEFPKALAFSPDGTRLFVANLMPQPHAPDEPPAPEVTVVDTVGGRVVERRLLNAANLLQDVTVAADGTVFVPLLRPKNLVPLVQVAGGWTMTNGVGVVRNGTTQQLLIDRFHRHYADPMAVAVNARWLFVAAGGADRVVVVDREAFTAALKERDPHLANRLDVAARFTLGEVETGAHPVALAWDGQRLYVANRLSDSVTVVDPQAMKVDRTIDLGGPDEPTAVRRGERLFYNSAATFHGQFSCASCHPAGRHDGLVYDISPDGLGKALVDSRTLLGVRGTAPFKWSGLNPDLHTQCGPRAAKFINRSPGFTPAQLDDLVEFMASLPLSRNRHSRGKLTPLQAWGQRIYERTLDNTGTPIPEANRCGFCHPGPRFTNNRAFDVGTAAGHDKTGLFDTPPLNNLLETGPYLHDGRALTLEELWTLYNPEDRHGRANDLGKDELNALIEYLKTL